MLKTRIRILYVNVLTCLFLAGLLEILLYFGLSRPEIIPSFLRPLFQKLYLTYERQVIQFSDCAHYDPLLFYTLKPGSCSFSNREFQTQYNVNSGGLRDDEQSLEAPAIVITGDSYAMGWGVDQHDTFEQRLERELQLPVLNAGVSSYGTAREMMMLERIDMKRVTHLLIQYHPSDDDENFTYIRNGFSLPVHSASYYDSIRLSVQEGKYYPFRYLYHTCSLIGKRFFRKSPPVTKQVLSSAEAFLQIVAHSKLDLSQIKIIVFMLDDPDHFDETFLDKIDSLKEAPPFNKMNLVTVRMQSLLVRENYFILDDHLRPEGHEKVARVLLEVLTSGQKAGAFSEKKLK